ncbi:DUF3895 domain-containing protein [Psychrobacillus sp. MER TA 171]|uniref:DUF3895 domain-containing protein n=1 Tax=Psychrobacillus sp. MER TA 171 TaxID=2939577 RepID=UPI00203ECCB4|nr:DUF3895 domain-containing protein [Psychrobacillus sp. MER TA 171]MCM3358121.1 DUF3895 domain-containing protein [Psychrobacillus sp. MER TA 171]
MNIDLLEYQTHRDSFRREKYLPINKREELLDLTTPAQRDYLNFLLKRGKKTIFANAMASYKGMVLPEDVTSQETEMLLEEWILEDYIDSGFVNKETCCECGRPLRYQYVVRHLTTNQVLKFGLNHFEQHMELPAEVVSAVKKGFLKIDYELDEVLQKIESGWSFEKNIGELPEGYILKPELNDMRELDLPLLDRQIDALIRDLNEFHDSREPAIDEVNNEPITINRFQTTNASRTSFFVNNALDLDFGTSDRVFSSIPYLQDKAHEMVLSGISSTRVICEVLIEKHRAPRERFLTGKPKIYPDIAMHLESYVQSGEFKVTHEKDKKDRKYFPVK